MDWLSFYNPGNRLGSYRSVNPKRRMAEVARAVANRNTSFVNDMTTAMAKNSSYDENMAALEDLIAQARKNGKTDDIAKYERIRRDIVTKTFPGLAAMNSEHAQTIERVVRNSKSVSRGVTITRTSVSSPVGSRRLVQDIQKNVMSITDRKLQNQAFDSMLSKMTGGAYLAKAEQNAMMEVSGRMKQIPMFQYIDTLMGKAAEGIDLSEELVEERMLASISAAGGDMAMPDYARFVSNIPATSDLDDLAEEASRAMHEYYNASMAERFADTRRGRVLGKRRSRKAYAKLIKFNNEYMGTQEGRSAFARHAVTLGGRAVSGSPEGIQDLFNPAVMMSMVDPVQYRTMARLGLVVDMDAMAERNQTTGHPRPLGQRSRASWLDFDNPLPDDVFVPDRVDDADYLMRTSPQAQALEGAYAQLRRAVSDPDVVNDPRLRKRIELGMSQLEEQYMYVTGRSKVGQARSALSASAAASIKGSYNEEAAGIMGDMYNLLYGGVRINAGPDDPYALFDRALLGQSGFVTKVAANKTGNVTYTVALTGNMRGTSGTNMSVNIDSLLAAQRASATRVMADGTAEAAARRFRSLGMIFDQGTTARQYIHRIEGDRLAEGTMSFFTKLAAQMHEGKLDEEVLNGLSELGSWGENLRRISASSAFSGADAYEQTRILIREAFKNGGISDFIQGAKQYLRAIEERDVPLKRAELFVEQAVTDVAAGIESSSAGADPLIRKASNRAVSEYIDSVINMRGRKGGLDRLYLAKMGSEQRARAEKVNVLLGRFKHMDMADAGDGGNMALLYQLLSFSAKDDGGIDYERFDQIVDAIRNGLDSPAYADNSSSWILMKTLGNNPVLGDLPSRLRSTPFGASHERTQAAIYSMISDAADASGSDEIRRIVNDMLPTGRNSQGYKASEIFKALRDARAEGVDRFETSLIGSVSRYLNLNEREGIYETLDDYTTAEIKGASFGGRLTIEGTDEELSRGGAHVEDTEDAAERFRNRSRTPSAVHAGQQTAGRSTHEAYLARVFAEYLDANEDVDADELLERLDIVGRIDESSYNMLSTAEKNKVNRYFIAQLHRSLQQGRKNSDEARELAKALGNAISIDGMNDVTYKAVKAADTFDDALKDQKISDYLVAVGRDAKTGDAVERAWRIVGDTAEAVDDVAATKLSRIAYVSEAGIGRMNGIVWDSAEHMNMTLAATGIDKRSMAKVVKQLMPDLAADVTVDDVLQAIASGNRNRVPEQGWMTSLDAMLGSRQVGASSVGATSGRMLDPFEVLWSAALHGTDVTREQRDAFSQAGASIESLIDMRRTGALADEITTVGKNFREAMSADPLKGLEEIAKMWDKAPTLSRIGIGAIAVGGLAAAYRSFSNDPIRTDEFLQYDHPGSAGIARVAQNDTGYGRPSAGRQIPSAPRGANSESVFKGFRGTVTLEDNMDSISSNDVNNMMNRM